MLKNAYFVAKIDADRAENELHRISLSVVARAESRGLHEDWLLRVGLDDPNHCMKIGSFQCIG